MPEDVATKEIHPTLPKRKRNARIANAAHLIYVKMPVKHHTSGQSD